MSIFLSSEHPLESSFLGFRWHRDRLQQPLFFLDLLFLFFSVFLVTFLPRSTSTF
ncbi:hypothetical protein Sjap_004715 [Stephania japonica]|uniref:Transmembrane protein n=1 Tax=Stephania japonica TaxID=461633 RepID=A0AAP0K4Z7_9MAGN